MRGKNTLFSAAVILLVLSNPVFAYRQVIDLGTLGGTSSGASSINDSGQIVGYAYNSSGQSRACLFDSTGGGANTNLGTLGGSQSVAYSINNNNKIVGQADGQACLFDPTGGGANTLLGGAGFGGSAYSINNGNKIVGVSGGGHACFFSHFKDLGTLNLDMRSTAYSISDNGKVVGKSCISSDIETDRRACLFDPTGGGANIYLGGLGGVGSTAYSINSNDLIVGAANLYRAPLFGDPLISHACIFDSSGGRDNIDLGALGLGGSCAEFVSNNGQIVGYAYDITGGPPSSPYIRSNYRACLFDPTGQGSNTDLNTLIDRSSGWTLNYAFCINNSGWIVGQGVHNNSTHAFLLTPEPATLLLFGLGGLILRKRKLY